MHLWVSPAVGQGEEVYTLSTTTRAFTEVQWQRTHARTSGTPDCGSTNTHTLHAPDDKNVPSRRIPRFDQDRAYLHAPLAPVAQFARHNPAMEGYWNTLSQSLEVVDRTRSRRRRVWMRVAQSFKLLQAASLLNFKSPAWEVSGSLP